MKTRISNEVYKMLEKNRVDSLEGRKIIEAIDKEYYSMDDFILYITMDIDSISLKFRTKKSKGKSLDVRRLRNNEVYETWKKEVFQDIDRVIYMNSDIYEGINNCTGKS